MIHFETRKPSGLIRPNVTLYGFRTSIYRMSNLFDFGSLKPKPIIFIQEELLQIGYPVRVELEFEFQIQYNYTIAREMHLVMENPDKLQIFINDSMESSHSCGWWRDVSFKKIDLGGFLQHGRNTNFLINIH